ncbi:MAG TPA: sodium:solute symporter family protein [Tepidisphaeraceae bacterium]|nr:sodium:solute symporter family protein [Tepidisphaeraceae bacterium]
MEKHTAIVIGLAIYACLMIAVALFWMVRVKQPTDYLVAGRGLPWWILTGNITATGIGTGVVIGASGLAYQHGWAGAAYPMGLGLGTILAGLLFARMRRYRFITLSEEIASYYGRNRAVVEFANISLFLSQLCWLTVQIMGGSAVLGAVLGLRPELCVLGSGVITACISIPGGLKTVAYTDTLQAVILLIGLGCLTFVALDDSGGVAGLRASVPQDYFSFLGVESFGTWEVVSIIVSLMLAVIADPGRRLSIFSASSQAGAKWSMLVGGAIVTAFSLVIGIVGMYTFRLNPNLPKADQAVPWLVMNVLPGWLAAFVVVSIASATFSSASTNAIATGTYFVRHIYPLATGGHYAARPLVAVRRALVCAFVLSTIVALQAGTIVGFVLKFLPLTMSGLAVIIVLGLFWKRATWQGALAALMVTPLVALAVMLIPAQEAFWNNPAVPATVAGLIAHVLVSLVTPRTTRTFEESAELLRLEREHALDTLEPQRAAPDTA